MRTIFLLLGLLIIYPSFSQDSTSPEARQKIQAARIALITERLGLTPDQAEKFWPVYREFSEKRRDTRHEFMRARRNHDPKTATEEQNQRLLKMGLEAKQRELNLEKEYSERLLRVIDSQQLVSLKKAEDDFRQMILRRIDHQRNMRERRQEMRKRNQDQIEKRRGN